MVQFSINGLNQEKDTCAVSSNDWIFPIKVCLLEHVTETPSINFKNLKYIFINICEN